MSGSYKRINYQLRPAKSVERKMMCETFRRLAAFGRVDAYRYVGFGSAYFRDFILVHRTLGITDMISIEVDAANERRFRFNVPFKCISLKLDHSNNVLRTLDWSVRTIVWLDYDGSLDGSVLADVQTVVSSAIPGSVLVVSVNAQLPELDDEREVDKIAQNRLEKLRSAVGDQRVPPDIDGKQLNKWGVAQVYRRIIQNEIESTLGEKNGVRKKGQKFKYQQLFNFHYQDGARMLTVGGVLYDEGQESHLRFADFEASPWFRDKEAPYLIAVPNLTAKELGHLDTLLPGAHREEYAETGIPATAVQEYEQIYRYFPSFAEVDM